MRVARPTYLGVFLSLATALCLVELAIARSIWFPLNADVISFAITIDLTLGLPLLYYLLLVRGRHSPAITLAPVFIVALILARLILPSAWQMHHARVELLLPLVEGAALVYGGLKARAVVRRYRSIRPTTVYASDALEASLRHTFGSSPLVSVLATELSIPYSAPSTPFRTKPCGACSKKRPQALAETAVVRRDGRRRLRVAHGGCPGSVC